MLEKLASSKWAKRFITLAGSLFIGSSVLFNQMNASAEEAVLTVLCHGIKSQPDSMKKLEDAIEDQSAVVNVYYPSTEQRIKNFAYNLDVAIKDKLVKLKEQDIDVNSIVLVGHSMGSIVERYYIECGNAGFADVVSKVKAVVLIAPPNHGSPLADAACYHAALKGERSDLIPPSIIELVESAKPTDDKAVIFIKELFLTPANRSNKTMGVSSAINFADSNWGKTSVYELNSFEDGFIKKELNKFGLKQGVYYCVVAGTDNNVPTTILINGPSDGVVPVESADIRDLVKNKENYRFETVKANHLNITENKDAIRIVKEVVSKFLFPSEKFFPDGWTSEQCMVKTATHHGDEEQQITYHKNTIGMKFVLIPPGKFMMGSEKGKTDERPVHPIRITKPFYMGAYEVTYAQYKMVTGKNHPIFENRFGYAPMDWVSRSDAVLFCTLLSKKEKTTYRLPTEAEWEYVCRAGSATEFYFANDDGHIRTSEGLVKKFTWSEENGPRHIGETRANPWGVYDMTVNFWEWCQDFYAKDYYCQSPIDDPFGPELPEFPSHPMYVARGGVYGTLDGGGARSAFRSRHYDEVAGDLGFRVIVTIKK
ncbi:MAG: SUMF1/EgtB/PvdO family nonheme iron enzyme [Candidatus Woesearchaeota archaeon]|nr:SUMF1/EgtB/PvdO family nonheme iron enzyme [Candidatus Woesearchaeota archaeon]